MKTFQEYTSLRSTCRFRSGRLSISPTAVHYKLINKTHKQTIIDWTEVSPASADVVVEIDAQLVRCIDPCRRQEEQEITFAADKDTSEQVTESRSWLVENSLAT